ncbi:hypothetical protein BX666DRAFT_2094852 [Dichotomocladium elegans]|nr:hypothetical protein BX666DRAFT_2094852 [Dichotomocladium elegans]
MISTFLLIMPPSLLETAADLLRESFVMDVADYADECPSVEQMEWSRFEAFVAKEEQRTGCTFYNQTGGSTRASNKKFEERLQQPVTNSSNGTGTSTLGVKRGRPSGTSFSVVWLNTYSSQ